MIFFFFDLFFLKFSYPRTLCDCNDSCTVKTGGAYYGEALSSAVVGGFTLSMANILGTGGGEEVEQKMTRDGAGIEN